jgi:hypothetical protein
MPYLEAEKILVENGFSVKGIEVNHNEATIVFKRTGSKPVFVCVGFHGKVSHKELGEFREGDTVLDLWKWLIGD